ncbi:MAG TPA: hypothetical protein PLQ35_14445 [bacterium]|nr:hypothetical protein [bacterium]
MDETLTLAKLIADAKELRLAISELIERLEELQAFQECRDTN